MIKTFLTGIINNLPRGTKYKRMVSLWMQGYKGWKKKYKR
jgi:hypothetical protein